MGFLKRIAGLLGLARDDVHDNDARHDADEEPDGQPRTTPFRVQETGLPRRGFSVPAHVVRDRPPLGPVIIPSTSGDGGVQVLQFPPIINNWAHSISCFSLFLLELKVALNLIGEILNLEMMKGTRKGLNFMHSGHRGKSFF